MTALCFVVRDKVEVPARGVQSAHIVWAVERYDCSGDIIVIKLPLVGGKRLVKALVGLFLLELAAHVHLFERAVDFHKIKQVLSVLVYGLVQRLLQGVDVVCL